MDSPTPPEPTQKAPDQRVPRRGTTPPADALLVTVEQARHLMQVDRATVYSLVADGSLKSFHRGRLIRISRRSIEELATSFGGGK